MQHMVNVLIQNKPAESCSPSVLGKLSNCLDQGDNWFILTERREILVREWALYGLGEILTAISGPTKKRNVISFEPN